MPTGTAHAATNPSVPREYKIIVTGTMGAGKTTAIAAISETPPISTEAVNSDLSQSNKPTTTVALDYGELTLDGGDRLRLYGTPGQARFSFMWGILARGALGVIILVDSTRADPLGDLAAYLEGFADLVRTGAAVIGITRLDLVPDTNLAAYYDLLDARGVNCPLLPTDARNPEEVMQLFSVLFSLIEFQLSQTVA